MKKAHWNAIIPQKISATSFWTNCQEHKLASNDILDGLTKKFPLKLAKKGLQMYNPLNLKRDVDLRIINKKCAQNLLILLHSSLKKYSGEQIKQSILRCDTSILSSDVIEQLLQSLPPVEQIIRLHEISNTGDKLSEGESFLAVLGGIEDVVTRLESINFKLCIEDDIQNVKENISSGIAACEEIKASKKFAKVLELILLFGNFMNFDSIYGQAYGFELTFLTKLKDTKDVNGKLTLLHYLVETIEKKYTDVLSFGEELHHSKKASRIDLAHIIEVVSGMEASQEKLTSILKTSKQSQTSDDIFTDVMVDFAVQCFGKIVDLKEMVKRMENLYKEVAEYFAFDVNKYPVDSLFTDIETFKESFQQAYKEILDIKKSQDKIQKTNQNCAARQLTSQQSNGIDEQKSTFARNDPAQLRNSIDLQFEEDIRKHCRGMEIKLTRVDTTGTCCVLVILL